jgi:hypothetical protein
LRDLAAQLKARIESVEQGRAQKAGRKKRRAAEEARRAAEEGIRAVVNNTCRPSRNTTRSSSSGPQSQNPPPDHRKTPFAPDSRSPHRDDANASVAVYLDFENAQGTTFQGISPFTLSGAETAGMCAS